MLWEMKEDDLWEFLRFSDFVKRESRYVLTRAHHDFVQRLRDDANERKFTMPGGTTLWRAQRDCGWELRGGPLYMSRSPIPHPPERMLPLSDRAKEGRVNPKGIPCLYTNTDPDTAMAEVRPWIGSMVTLAELRTDMDLMLVKCTSDAIPSTIGADIQVQDDRCWDEINDAFRTPTNRDDDVADYAPTQLLAELFRSCGADGIVYSSALGSGLTVVLFDVGAATVVQCRLFETADIAVFFWEKKVS